MATGKSRRSCGGGSSNYDVFLSFRGIDTRKTFTDHLYRALKSAGVETFRDDDEIERGEYIKSELERAIKGSKMSVIVFSKDYASSKACLTEVETILEHSKNGEHGILPVFYHVDPSELKQQARLLGAVATEERHRGWAAALQEVADIAGMNLIDQYEATFIRDIVKVVEGKLIFRVLNVGPNLIGMDSRVTKLNLWLKDRSTDVSMHVICGMGGVGKTTTAKFVYNSNHRRFDGSSFIENIKEASKDRAGLVRLQRQLLSDILHKEERKIFSVDEGLNRIQFILRDKRVLLVLDDVDEMDQLNAIFGSRSWFSRGSKIIITTRREHLLKVDEIYEVHRIERLNSDESLELFSWHAFGQRHPLSNFMEHSKRFVHHCQGLPLALEVLGSSVGGRDLDFWEAVLKRLEEIPEAKVREILKISYDSLQDQSDKNLFLDIACFFVGKKKNDTVTILDGCRYHTAVGIQNLIDRNLLTIENDKLGMHQLLQNMGRHIVYQESEYPENHSRLWRHNQSFDILREKIGTEKNLGLVLDMDMLKKISDFDEEVLETVAFERMCNLRLLKLGYAQLVGTYEVLPKKLKWLYWRGFHLKILPNGFPLENVVALDMRNSNLEYVWKQIKVLKALKILNLSHSPHLAKTPDFSRIPNLEKLILKDCPSLVEVDESIANLGRLIVLNLQDCKNLRKLPRNISTVKSLEQLIISGCSSLAGAAEELEKMDSLRVLRADRIALNQVLSASKEIAPWYAFTLPWVAKPRRNLEISWTSLPSSLVTLTLVDSNLSDDAFPKDFGSLPSLQHLYLGGNPICWLPDFIKNLAKLQKLDLSWCPRLQQIQWPSLVVKELVLTECRSLEKITYETWTGPQSISHGACVNLNYVESGFKIEQVGKVDVEVINNIGFFELNSMADVEAMIVNTIVWSRKKCPIQILYEDGIFTTYYPGRKVPEQFSNKKSGSSTIVFTVPSSSNLGIRGLNLCVVYKLPAGIVDWLPLPISVTISNKSKDRERKYTPRCYGIPEADEDMVWLSHWLQMFWGALFEEGDEVEVCFSMNVDGEIKECGVHFLCFEQGGVSKYFQTLHSSWDPWMDVFRIFHHAAHQRASLVPADDHDAEEKEEHKEEEDDDDEEEEEWVITEAT